MKKNLFFLCLLILCVSCATTGQRAEIYRSSDFICIDDFCKQHDLQYSFNTLDDIVKIYSNRIDTRLILGSSVAYYNGQIFNLKESPEYSEGRIFVPRQLGKILFSKEPILFKPAFTIKTIVIDPGHGGKDPGAISCRGMKEKNLNLKISKYLKNELEERGFRVFLTRDKDVFLSLQSRVDIAKRHKADIFISIHANSNRSRKIRGTEVYYLTPSRLNSEERALKMAKQEKLCQGGDLDAERILWDMIFTKNYALSVDLSHSLYFSFRNLGFSVKPPRKAPFYVLRLAYVPSVLVETGYLSNRYEEKWLQKSSYQKQIAEAIALAVTSMDKKHDYLTHR